MTTANNSPTHWFLCLGVGFLSTMCLVFGYNIYICSGIFGGAIWTLAMAAFFMFFPPYILGNLALAIGALTFGAHLLSRHPHTRGRREIAALILPIACLLAANGYAYAVRSDGVCKMGEWK